MENITFDNSHNPNFTGRKNELLWLDEKLHPSRNHSRNSIFISGVAGSGKTSLVREWFTSRRAARQPYWISLKKYKHFSNAVENVIQYVKDVQDISESSRLYRDLTIVIDDCDNLEEIECEEISSRIFNYKAVDCLILLSRENIAPKRFQHLSLGAMSQSESESLLSKLLSSDFSSSELLEAIIASKGYPLAIELLSKILKGEHTGTLSSLLEQPLYDLSNNLLIPTKEIITSVSPIIVSANQTLVVSLQKQPSDLHKLSPREFEILLADLLKDMGWEVELTKQTRDGGADILAYLNTDVGRLLCLVEAKHYRQDRKIGVDLVRTLYGTLCDAQANSAMLVTSSSFTKDAREFQQKHQYQLSLRDYADIVNWIIKYGDKTSKFN